MTPAAVPVRGPARAVRAVARMTAAPDGRGGTALPLLAGEGPLALRRTGPSAPGHAHVTVVGAMSAPLGGDRLRIEAEVRSGARLTVGASAATVSLPGAGGEPATYDVRLTVGPGAELRWLPEPVIAARGSDLLMTTRVDLAAGARLLLREEQILGRHGEPSGRIVARTVVRYDGRTLLEQELSFGPGASPGWDGPAVLGGRRAVGQLLCVAPGVGPDLLQDLAPPPAPASSPPGPARAPRPEDRDGTAAPTVLAGPGILVTAVAADGRHLRRLLDSSLDRLPSWDGPRAIAPVSRTNADEKSMI